LGNIGSFVVKETIMKLAIELSEAQEQRLAEIAERLKVPAESLAEAAVRDLVSQPEPAFDQVAERLLHKNQELYERLG